MLIYFLNKINIIINTNQTFMYICIMEQTRLNTPGMVGTLEFNDRLNGNYSPEKGYNAITAEAIEKYIKEVFNKKPLL